MGAAESTLSSAQHTNAKSHRDSDDAAHQSLHEYANTRNIRFLTTPNSIQDSLDDVKCGTIVMMLYSNGCGHCHNTLAHMRQMFEAHRDSSELDNVTWLLLCDDYPGMLPRMQQLVPTERITGYPTLWILYKSGSTLLFKGKVMRGSPERIYNSVVAHAVSTCKLAPQSMRQYNTALMTSSEMKSNSVIPSPLDTLRVEPRVRWIQQVPPPFEASSNATEASEPRYVILYVYLTSCHTCHRVARAIKDRLNLQHSQQRQLTRLDHCEWWMLDGEADATSTWLRQQGCSDDGYPMMIVYTSDGTKVGEIEISTNSDRWATQMDRMCTPLAHPDPVWTQ